MNKSIRLGAGIALLLIVALLVNFTVVQGFREEKYAQSPLNSRTVVELRQINRGGQWVEAPVQAATVQKLEDVILTRARDLRRQAIAG